MPRGGSLSKDLVITRNRFYEMMAERLPRCLEILDEHLDKGNQSPSAQRWAVETIFEKLLPTLVAAPAQQETLAGALSDILKKRSLDEVPEIQDPAPGIQDVEIITDGEKRHVTALAETRKPEAGQP